MNIVIAGAGGVGSYLVQRLVVEDHALTVIEQNDDIREKLCSQYDIRGVAGSATTLSTLRLAGVQDSDIFIAATSSDEANLIACLLAHSLNTRVRKIARVQNIETDGAWLSAEIAGIFDQFINQHIEAAAILINLFQVPGACEVLEFADGAVRIIGLVLPPESPILNKKLKELTLEEDFSHMLVAAIVRREQLIIPSGEDRLQAGDLIYVVANPEDTETIFDRVGIEQTEIKRVIISGGTPIGKMLAQALVEDEISVKLIEPDSSRCEELAEELNGVVILNGEGKDQDLLIQEGIEETDMFVAVAADEEDNILSALLAKKLGARMAAVTIQKMSYMSLVTTIGIDIVVNPRMVAGSSILKHVRGSGVSSVFTLRDDTAEVLEIIAGEEWNITGKAIKDMKLPAGVLVAALVNNGELTIPRGNTIIGLGDKVIIFAQRKSLAKLERAIGRPINKSN